MKTESLNLESILSDAEALRGRLSEERKAFFAAGFTIKTAHLQSAVGAVDNAIRLILLAQRQDLADAEAQAQLNHLGQAIDKMFGLNQGGR